nr:pentatricopeptide repeat-containing protein At4g04790, mitochondrial-like [Ipomoea batatas]GME10489.1 pentatricopeptide repeat-containing protein At4g04790, mitochondrial-like [Ipomoea batatas]
MRSGKEFPRSVFSPASSCLRRPKTQFDELDDRDYQVDASFRVISYCIRHEQFRPVIGLLKKLKEMYCNDEVAREVLFDEVFFSCSLIVTSEILWQGAHFNPAEGI